MNKNPFSFFLFFRRKNKYQKCYGVSSRCKNNSHILMLDYDYTNLDIVERDIENLQKKYKKGNAYIFFTRYDPVNKKGNFHVYFLDKDFYHNNLKMMKELHIDRKQLEAQDYLPFKSFVLRISGKVNSNRPLYLFSVKSKHNQKNEKSNAHRILLEKLGKIKISKDKTFDNETKIETHIYSTVFNKSNKQENISIDI